MLRLAQVNSVARIARPRRTTAIPGPGSTKSAAPTTSVTTPTDAARIRLTGLGNELHEAPALSTHAGLRMARVFLVELVRIFCPAHSEQARHHGRSDDRDDYAEADRGGDLEERMAHDHLDADPHQHQ